MSSFLERQFGLSTLYMYIYVLVVVVVVVKIIWPLTKILFLDLKVLF